MDVAALEVHVVPCEAQGFSVSHASISDEIEAWKEVVFLGFREGQHLANCSYLRGDTSRLDSVGGDTRDTELW